MKSIIPTKSIIPINFYTVKYFKNMLTYYRKDKQHYNYTKDCIGKFRNKIPTHQNTEYRNRAGRFSYA